MATSKDWAEYKSLVNAIADAIDSACENGLDENKGKIVLAISPDLDDVQCILDGSSFEVIEFLSRHNGWHIESATNYEDAVRIADLYFDLR